MKKRNKFYRTPNGGVVVVVVKINTNCFTTGVIILLLKLNVKYRAIQHRKEKAHRPANYKQVPYRM